MSKIIIAGTTMTIESAHTLKNIEKVARYKPSALQLVDKDHNPYFYLLPGTVGNVQDSGVTFADVAPDDSGAAVITLGLPKISGKTVKQAVAETYGPVIANINKVEAQITNAIGETDTMLSEIESQIVIAGGATSEVAADGADLPCEG